jgi:glycosyltransferase involved in cell wall biosynthesis
MVPTPAMVDYCSKMGIKRVKIWSRGVDTDVFKPDPNWQKMSVEKVIRAIYVGRISAEKNLEAFLKINNSNIFKILVGDGPQLEEYKAKYPNALFLGRKTPEEIARLLQVQDVFAWPSLTDTFGLVVLEAMACGLPVAAFDNEVNRYIIDEKSGYLTKDDLNVAITGAFLLKREDAIERAKKFSWETATGQFVENLV